MNLPPIIDSHHRLNASAARPAALAALLAESGVERSVLVQPEPSLDGTRAALALADKAEFVAGAAVWADVESVALGALLDELGANPKLRGVCLPAHLQESNHWLAQDAVLAGLREVAKRGLSLDVIVEPRQIPSVRVLAEAVPDLRIALAHIGSPYIARGEREPWGVYILNLAAMRNVSVKISGLVTLDTQPDWNVAHLKLFVEPIVRLFGYSRVMFGSDWPAHTAVAGYQETLNAAIEAAGPMTEPQLAQVLGGAAAEFYRLG